MSSGVVQVGARDSQALFEDGPVARRNGLAQASTGGSHGELVLEDPVEGL